MIASSRSEKDKFICFCVEIRNNKKFVVEYLDLSLKKLEIKNLNINNIIKSEIYKLIESNNYTLANILHSDLVFINNNFRD